MKKIVLCLLTLLMLSGCSINYDLEFKDGVINDKLDLYISNESYKNYANSIKDHPMEATVYEYFEDMQLQVFKQIPNTFHKKESKKRSNGLELSFSYDGYAYSTFNSSYLLNSCFAEVNTLNEDDYYYINVKGPFACYYGTTVIRIKTDRKVINTNAKYDDGVYTFEINKDNLNDIDLVFHIDKDEAFSKAEAEKKAEKENGGSNNSFIWIILLSCGLVGLFVLNKKINNKR